MTQSSPFWRQTLRVVFVLLACWMVLGFGCSILWVQWLDRFRFCGFGLGFWFAQQGAIVGFVGIVLVYALWMDRLERRRRAERASRSEP